MQTKNSIKLADEIIVFSDYTKNEFHRLYPAFSKKKIKRIYPGLDHVARKGNNKNINKYGNYYLYVGVIKPIKNIELLIQVFFNFVQKTKNNTIKLILIGSKEKDYYNLLINLDNYKKISHQVLFIDDVSDKDLFSFYRKALAVLNLSHEEGFCFPIFEALYIGQKVIVKELPLYQEIAGDDQNIMICRNKKDITEKMISVYEQVGSWRNNNTQMKFNKLFRWGKFTASILDEFQIQKNDV